MNKEDKVLLDKLKTWANPRIEVCYRETGINEASKVCFAIGNLISVQEDYYGEIVLAPVEGHPIVFTIADMEKRYHPVLIHIPLESILTITLLIPEDPTKVESVKSGRKKRK